MKIFDLGLDTNRDIPSNMAERATKRARLEDDTPALEADADMAEVERDEFSDLEEGSNSSEGESLDSEGAEILDANEAAQQPKAKSALSCSRTWTNLTTYRTTQTSSITFSFRCFAQYTLSRSRTVSQSYSTLEQIKQSRFPRQISQTREKSTTILADDQT